MKTEELIKKCQMYLAQGTQQDYMQLHDLLFGAAHENIVMQNDALLCLRSMSSIWQMEQTDAIQMIFANVSDIHQAIDKYQQMKFATRRMEQGMEEVICFPAFQSLMQSGISVQALYYVIKKEVRRSMQTMLLAAGFLEKLGMESMRDELLLLIAQTPFADYEKEPIAGMQNDSRRTTYDGIKGHRFDFIVCTNDEQFMQECALYISRLYVPDGCSINLLTIEGAASMAAGYNEGLEAADGDIQIFLHQDVFITNRFFLYEILTLFECDEEIGMIGMVGSKMLPDDAMMWHGKRVGAIYSASDVDTSHVANRLEPVSDEKLFEEVEALDGLLLVSNRQIPFRSDLFDGWDFYDLSACMEHRRRGYKIVVPRQDEPWCIHDCGSANLTAYEGYRQKFLAEYGRELLYNQTI